MIQFLTLFIGLVGGIQNIAMTAAPQVASIELRWRGETVARLESPPWEVQVDFGQEIFPGVLDAVAFDESGREIARISQELNVPRPRAEARFLLDRDENGHPRSARLAWESVLGRDPNEISILVDGEPAGELRAGILDLRPLDDGDFHLLQAELRFSNELAAQAEIGIGAEVMDSADAGLTAG